MKDALGHGSNSRGGGDATTRTQSGLQMLGRKPTPGEQKQLGQMTKAFSTFAGEMNKGSDVAAAHQAAVNAVGGKFRLNSFTHEIVSPSGDVSARMRLGKNNGLSVDARDTGEISRSGGTAIHDAVAMADYRATKGSFPAENIGGELHYLTGNEFKGHTVRRVK